MIVIGEGMLRIRPAPPATPGSRPCGRLLRLVGAAILLLSVCGPSRGQSPTSTGPPRPSFADLVKDEDAPPPPPPRVEMSLVGTIADSLTGDVYAKGRWRPLTFRGLFRDGWREPWAAGPDGRSGLTPRQGWLGAFDGVFYRLHLHTLRYDHHLNTSYGGDRYTGTSSIFLPFSRRFEILLDVPFVVSNGKAGPGGGYRSESGDLTIAPRFLLAESKATTQVFALGIRTPTGSKATGNGLMGLTPRYEFWTNPVGPWVVRGSGGFFVPLNRAEAPSRTTFTGGLAAGRYFRPHDVPFGDLVLYGACNFRVPLDGQVAHDPITSNGRRSLEQAGGTQVSVGPGTRFHLAKNYFFLNYWDIPVTGPHPYTYNAQFAIMKVF